MLKYNFETKDLQTEKIISAAIEVHGILGPGFLESALSPKSQEDCGDI